MHTLASSALPGYESWQFSARSARVEAAPGVMREMMRRGRRWFGKRQETGGLLLGYAEQDGDTLVIRIEDSIEVPSEHLFGKDYTLSSNDREAFTAARETSLSGDPRLYPVGVYRLNFRKDDTPDADDRSLFAEQFGGDYNVLLLLKPRALRRGLASFCIWEDGDPDNEPAVARGPAGRRGRRHKEDSPAATPRVLAPKRTQRVPLWCSWWVQVPLLVFLLATDGILGFYSAQQFHSLVPAAAGERNPYALSLLVLEYGDNLHLTWDRHARALAEAERGILVITDAGQSQSMELTNEQLQGGSVIYRKVSNDIRFRLEILLKHHRSVSETWEPGTGASAPGPPITKP